jgi:hypothetical protein
MDIQFAVEDRDSAYVWFQSEPIEGAVPATLFLGEFTLEQAEDESATVWLESQNPETGAFEYRLVPYSDDVDYFEVYWDDKQVPIPTPIFMKPGQTIEDYNNIDI